MRRKERTREQAGRGSTQTPMTVADFVARELPSVIDIVTFCGTVPISLYADATGVKSPEAVYRGAVLSRNRLVSESYLLNFRPSEADFGVVVGTSNYRLPMALGAQATRDLEEDEEQLVALPPYQTVRAPLGSVVRSRRSIRRYSGRAISLQELSTLLFHASGISGELALENVPQTAALAGRDHIDLRTVASGGALYPIDLYVLALNVEGLAAGAYRYLPKRHALIPPAAPGPLPAVTSLAQFAEIEVEKASLLLGYVYNLFENARKYGEPALGFAFLEAGGMSAHAHLVCTALGLGSCDVGSFSKGRLERLFAADGVSRHVIHLTVVGK